MCPGVKRMLAISDSYRFTGVFRRLNCRQMSSRRPDTLRAALAARMVGWFEGILLEVED